ncbi:MAG: peptidase T4 [Hirschia sp.]|nr:peptidase T4 [Hirschia sp.]MBF17345.1 peptidase T4 [Hirschia sp.]
MRTARPGDKNLITDVSGLSVGCAHDVGARTGVTVIMPSQRAVCAVAVAGGGPGTRETDALSADRLVDAVDAVVLSGGSVYGLAAADAVTAAMGAEAKGFALMDLPGVPRSPVVPSAILYDLANGGDKAWADVPPYHALGRQAYADCQVNKGNSFQLGKSGAGYGARAGAEEGGLGSASVIGADGVTVGALVAVNAFGSTRMPGSDAFWAWPYEINQEFGGARPPADFALDPDDWGQAKANPAAMHRANTTIACIATDVALTPAQASRVAQMALSGLSRSIRPVFAPFDGDVVFVLSTATRSLDLPEPMAIARIGELAAGTLARAVARGVHEASLDKS